MVFFTTSAEALGRSGRSGKSQKKIDKSGDIYLWVIPVGILGLSCDGGQILLHETSLELGGSGHQLATLCPLASVYLSPPPKIITFSTNMNTYMHTWVLQ